MHKILSNKEILISTGNFKQDPLKLQAGQVLTFENSDIAFHYETFIKNLDISDPSEPLHYSPYDYDKKWQPKVIKMMYLLTKSVNSNVKKFLQLPIPRFLAVSITGMGGSTLEPNVKPYPEVFEQIAEIIDLGFHPSDIVIRIDPMYPGINTPDIASDLLEDIILKTHNLGISQIYSSMFDIYASTPKDFLKVLDYSKYSDKNFKDNVLHANEDYLKESFSKLDDLIYRLGNGLIDHILCGEIPSVIPPHSKKIGCLNKDRIEKTLFRNVINIKDRTLLDKNVQRHYCLCAVTNDGRKLKRQGLTSLDTCFHGCQGCYISKNSNL